MPTAILSPNAKQQFLDNAGNPAASYRLYTYAANTTTPRATYTNRAGSVANANPIILDARGEAIIYLSPGVVYDYVLKTDQDVTIWTREDVIADAGDANAVTFLQEGTGAVTRSSQDKMRERISVLDFGAVGDGVTNDTAAFQKAIAAAVKRELYVPKRKYLVDPLTITEPMVICGDGAGLVSSVDSGTVFIPNSNTSNVFVVDTTAEVTFRDFAIVHQGSATAGAGIVLSETSPSLGVGNLFSTVDNVRFENMYIGVDAVSASSFRISDCVFWNIRPNGFGIRLDNTIHDDQGDQCIDGNTFHATASSLSATGLHWIGGGGMRFVNNKVLMNRAIFANLATAQATAQFIINANSFDANQGPDATAVMVYLVVGSGTIPFENIVVNGNIFIGYYSMTSALIVAGLPAAKVSKVAVTGNNVINVTPGAFTGSAAVVFADVDDFLANDNLILGSGSACGILTTASCTNGSVMDNRIRGFTTAKSVAGTGVVSRGITNSGVTASVSDGGVISHGLAVTPTKVWVNGSVAAQTYGAFGLTSSQFQVSVRNTAGASGSAATIYWMVEA